MSWRVKPSATMEIERRDEPYCTRAMKERWTNEVRPRYETSQGALMPILHDLQHAYRHIPYQAMIEVAQFLEIAPGDVLDCVSFYEEFHAEPTGKYVIGVCQSIACEVCGHRHILDHLRTKLDLEPHETSDDGRFTLLTMECLGSCDTAPVALVNETLHEHLTIEKLDVILNELE